VGVGQQGVVPDLGAIGGEGTRGGGHRCDYRGGGPSGDLSANAARDSFRDR
jgi:hypothetical protein